jgi:adenylate cyclase
MTGAVQTETSTPGSAWLNWVLGVIWACGVALVLTVASLAGVSPEGPDEWTYDWRTLFFSQRAEQPRDDIAIILIDEESMRDYDYISPIDRGLVAKLLQGLDAAGPRAVGLDFIYDRKSEEGKTQALIDAIRTMRAPIIFGAIDRRIRGIRAEDLKYQDDFIAKTGREAGHVFFARQLDQLKIGDQVVRYMGERSPAPPHRKSIAQLLVEKVGATSPSEPATPYIAWLLPPRGADLFPLFRVPRHNPDAGPEAILPESWRQALHGKIVLIGGDFVDRDKHLTPLSVLDGAKMPGVVVQAQILAQLRDGRSIHEVPWRTELALLTLIAVLGFAVSRLLHVERRELLIYFGGLAALVLLGAVMFSNYAVIIPTTTLFFAWTAGVAGGHYSGMMARKLRVARS